MKVLQLHNAYAGSEGGEDVTVAQESELLRSAGHAVTTHEVTNPERGAGAAASFGASAWNPRSARRVAELVAELDPDVVHAHNLWFSLSPSVLRSARASGARVVLTLHNFRLVCVNANLYRDGHLCQDCVGHIPWRGVWHRCYRDSAPASAMLATTLMANRAIRTWRRYVDAFLAHTEFAASRLLHGGVPPERVVIKPNFVPEPGPRTLPAESGRSILYVGRLAAEKGIAEVVEAWRRTPPVGLELVVCGNGPLRAELERNAPPGVRFTGWIPHDDVRSLMLAARASVFPSRMYEGGNPLAVLESYAAALPVLATDIGAGGELARSVGDDWVVADGDIGGWSEALAGLADDTRISAASRHARSEFEARYTAERALDALERVYRGEIPAASV